MLWLILYARTQPPRERQIAGYEPEEFHVKATPIKADPREAARRRMRDGCAARRQRDEIERLGSEHRAPDHVYTHTSSRETRSARLPRSPGPHKEISGAHARLCPLRLGSAGLPAISPCTSVANRFNPVIPQRVKYRTAN